jgi:hypothetical protein
VRISIEKHSSGRPGLRQCVLALSGHNERSCHGYKSALVALYKCISLYELVRGCQIAEHYVLTTTTLGGSQKRVEFQLNG